MAIKEIQNFPKKSDNLHRVWEISIKGKTLILNRYGNFCGWNKLILEKNSKEVYRINIKPHYKNRNDKGVRTEFFLNKFFREYLGNQFSFIEYLEIMNNKQDFPDKHELIKKGLEKKFCEKYHEQAKAILDSAS